jgi:Protein of unknown function (DUF3048) N-terminal domain/Protein of unknown function (DUF3048) C-terminal domain
VVRKTLLCAITCALLAVLAACADDAPPAPPAAPAQPPASPSATATATATATALPPAPAAGTVWSPLTGRPVRNRGPVLAVKIDNTRAAYPQAGLTAADVVYVEQVEGGLTRLLAVYSTRLPRLVGPVRSARVTDPELLRQYGPVALAYSGASAAFARQLRAAPLRLVSNDNSGRGYQRLGSRRAPYNLFGRPRALLARAPRAATARDVGFRFGPPPPGGRGVTSGAASYPAARVSWAWVASSRRWVISMTGRPAQAAEGGRVGAPTVVVQLVETSRSQYRDRLGNVTPFMRTVGQGKAYVFRDGRMHSAAWSRRDPDAGTSFTRADGRPMTFAPGPVWVLLVDRDRPAAVTAS